MVISFIGCGFSANSILYHLNKLLTVIDNRQIIINIYESRRSFGDGLSYNVNNEHVLLNRPAKHMSIDHNNLSDFRRYLQRNTLKTNEYETRKAFGLYLKETLKSSITSLKQKNIIINSYNYYVLDINKIKNKFEITTVNGCFFSNIIILSTGNNYQNNIWQLESNRYINNLYYEFQLLNQIKSNERVLIIGASLSAIDCALFLENNGHNNTISFMSRSGIIPKVRLTNANIELPIFRELVANEKPNISLFQLAKYLRRQIKSLSTESSWQDLLRKYNLLTLESLTEAVIKGNDEIQNILTSSNPYIETLWDKLLDKDKLDFFNKFYTLYMSNRNPMPKISAERLIALLESNKLEVFNNEISSITFDNNEFTVRFEDGNCLNVNWIINATGQSKDIAINPLYKRLLKHGLVRKNIIGGLDVSKVNQLCFSDDGKVVQGLYAIGPKTLGAYINVNSAEMLSIKAECIAKDLVQRMEVTSK